MNNKIEFNSSDNQLDYRQAMVKIWEGFSYDQILAEQNYEPVSYQEFRKLADQIEWNQSLEDLLEALD
jgi:hypothetical protein